MKLKWGDFIIFFAIASAIVLMFFLSAPKADENYLTAEISKDGEVVYEIDLMQIEGTQQYPMDDGDVIIEAEQGRIRFLESDCPNQICVYTGWIDKANQVAACLPNKILVRLIGSGGDDEVDAVVK